MTPDAILDGLKQGTLRRPMQPSGPLCEGIATGEPDVAPRLLALAVQAKAYAIPPAPAQFDDVPPQTDTRRIVPGDLRPLIMRLVTGKGNSPDDAAASALALAFGQSGLRLHPFDMPRLKPFVSKHAETLGIEPDENAVKDTITDSGWFSWEAVDLSNWTLATPARKATFIADMRSRDPAAARELVAAQLPMEKADVRLRLINALATGLSHDDQEFLESLSGDRAPTVKQAVQRLLARLPGTGAAEEQVKELLSRITIGSTGLLRKRATLSLQMPANVKYAAAEYNWLAANFGAIGSSALAEALGLSPESMLEAARDDSKLVCGIAFSACSERNWPLLAAIMQGIDPDLWTVFLETGVAEFGLTSPSDRAEWAAVAIPKRFDIARFHAYHAGALHNIMGGPLPLVQARAVLAAASLSHHPSEELMVAAGALVPDVGLAEAAATLDHLPPEHTGRARLLVDILIRLNEGRNQP